MNPSPEYPIVIRVTDESTLFEIPNAGFAEAHPCHSDPDAFHLEAIAVNREARGNKLSRLLVSRVVQFARESGYQRLTSDVCSELIGKVLLTSFDPNSIHAIRNDFGSGDGEVLSPQAAHEYLQSHRHSSGTDPTDMQMASVHYTIDIS